MKANAWVTGACVRPTRPLTYHEVCRRGRLHCLRLLYSPLIKALSCSDEKLIEAITYCRHETSRLMSLIWKILSDNTIDFSYAVLINSDFMSWFLALVFLSWNNNWKQCLRSAPNPCHDTNKGQTQKWLWGSWFIDKSAWKKCHDSFIETWLCLLCLLWVYVLWLPIGCQA